MDQGVEVTQSGPARARRRCKFLVNLASQAEWRGFLSAADPLLLSCAGYSQAHLVSAPF